LIDDTKPKQRKPVKFVSFHDLRQLGFEIFVRTYEKEKPSGGTQTAVRVLKVLKDGKEFPRAHTMELLRVLGLDIEGTVWVTDKKTHRCLSQKEPVYDYRYCAYERQDSEYLSSGRASMEAIMWSSNMEDFSEEAERLKGGDSG